MAGDEIEKKLSSRGCAEDDSDVALQRDIDRVKRLPNR
jgi:hypothetical protein